MKPEPDFSWEAIGSLREERFSRARPEGAFTVSEYVKKFGIHQDTARKELTQLVADDRLEKIAGFIEGTKGMRKTTYYREVKYAKAKELSVRGRG